MSTFFVHVRTWECILSGRLGKERNPVKNVRDRGVRGQKELKPQAFTEGSLSQLLKTCLLKLPIRLALESMKKAEIFSPQI